MENSSKENSSIVPIDLKKRLEENEVREKIEKFEKHLSYFDDDPNYFLVLASLKLKIEDIQGALHYMNEACKLFPKQEFIYEMRAKMLYKMKDYNGALTNLNQAIVINPQSESYYYRRGKVLFCLKIYSKANEDFSKAIEMNSSIDTYFFNRALARGILHDYKSAIADLEKVLVLNPNHTKAKDIITNLNKFLSRKNLG
jgi:tetratricopeptide (TPR) repeat protein